MAALSTGTLQSLRPLCFNSPILPKFSSQSLWISSPKSRPPPVAAVSSRKLQNIAISSRSRPLVRASASEFATNSGELLGEISIFTVGGEPLLFKDLWDQNEGVAVVALLRHFGCPCCWELASTLKESKARFDSAGVKLIAVGVGEPNKARLLAERLASGTAALNVEIVTLSNDCLYADPDRKVYKLLGLYYGIGRTFFNPASAKVFSRFDSLQKAVKNYTIDATPDDRSSVLQQGGMFVFKGKQLLYSWKDEGTGDHAPLDDVFDVCCKVPVA